MQVVVITVAGIILVVLLLAWGDGNYRYRFEERTVKARFLEAARRKLNDYHSPLIDTNDPSII